MIVIMEPWHLMSVALNMRAEDRIEIEMSEGDVQRWACQRALAPGVAFTALDEKLLPVACFGFREDRDIGAAWLVATDRGYLYRKSMIKTFRKIIAAKPFRTIEAACRVPREGAQQLVEYLGFKYCGLVPKHFPNGESLALFSLEVT